MNEIPGFLMTLEQAEVFYKRCEERKAETFEQRLEILKEMANERRVFPQSAEQIKKRLKGKKVGKIGFKRGEE